MSVTSRTLAYKLSLSLEKCYVVSGQEFGLENVGKCAIIVCDVYGGRTSRADYWRHFRSSMEEIGFSSCKADPDVWFRLELKHNGVDYYQFFSSTQIRF